MKRMYVGAALLVMMLAVGIALTVAFDRIHEPLSRALYEAGGAALDEDWETALDRAQEARQAWARMRDFIAAVADHEVLEQMDGLFAQLQVWARLKQADQFAAVCGCMAELAWALGQSQAVTWWNLL